MSTKVCSNNFVRGYRTSECSTPPLYVTFVEVHVKRSVILTDRLGPDILLVLTMKRQILHRERAHLKVPGCSLVLSALLTKKLPSFLSRLNEISGGCEKILPVSGSF